MKLFVYCKKINDIKQKTYLETITEIFYNKR